MPRGRYCLLPCSALCGYRVYTLLCRGSGLPLLFLLSPANVHDAPFARPLLAWAVLLYQMRPRILRLDAGYWGLRLAMFPVAYLVEVFALPQIILRGGAKVLAVVRRQRQR